MRRRDLGLGAEQVRRSDLHCRSTQGQCRQQAAVVSNATGGNHRHADRIGHLWHQGEGADLAGDIVAEEHAAMAARFIAHGNDRITAVVLQPHGFLYGGGAGQHLGTAGLYPLQQVGLGQAEVETHHLRAQLLDQLAALFVERRAVGHRRGRREVCAHFAVIGLERLLPACIALGIGRWRLVAEEVQIQRAARAAGAEGGDFGAHLVAREHGAGQGTQTARQAHGNGHARARRTGHGGLQNGQLDAQQVEDAAVGPVAHAVLLARASGAAGRGLTRLC